MNTTALYYALGTVVCWGLYSVLLHKGSVLMANGPVDAGARMKAFLMVGIAYFVVGIMGPMVLMKVRGVALEFPSGGVLWSLLAGLAGAVGAFFLLMGLSSGTTRQESLSLVLLVPAIVFAGAPIVNAIVSITKDGVWNRTPWQFYAGMLLASAGVALVMQYRPLAGPAAPAKAALGPVAAPTPVVGARATAAVDVTTRKWQVS